MRRDILLGAIFVLAILSLCSVFASCDSDADGDPALYLEDKDGEKVGQAEDYGWSANVTYGSETYTLVISDDTGISYEWERDGEPVSTERTFDINVKCGSADYYAYIDLGTGRTPVGHVHIETAKKTVEINVPTTAVMYDGTDVHRLEVQTGVGNETLTAVLKFSSSVPNTYVWSNTELNRYSLSGWESGTGDLNDYDPQTGEMMGDITISKRDLTITANEQTITYGNPIATGTDNVSMTGNVEGHTLTAITLTADTSTVGDSEVMPSAATIMDGDTNVTDYYNMIYQAGRLIINQRDLTITANEQTITYGNPIATGTDNVSMTGNVEGHTLTAITLTADTSTVGDSEVMPSAATIMDGDTNVTDYYNMIYQAGRLIINQRDLTITANEQTITYGNPIATGTDNVSMTGNVEGHKLTAITLVAEGSEVETGGTIMPSAATIMDGDTNVTGNYNITYGPGALKINARDLTITAKEQTITYGNPIATGTDNASMTGNVEGHKLTAITLVSVGSYVKTGGTIIPSAATIMNDEVDVTGNYNITYEPGVLKINARDLTITANELSIKYGDPLGSDVTMTGNVEGHKVSSVTMSSNITGVGDGTITPSEAKIEDASGNDVTDNYSISYVSGDLHVSKRDVTLGIPVPGEGEEPVSVQYNGTSKHDFELRTGVEDETLIVTLEFSESGLPGHTYSRTDPSYYYMLNTWASGTGQKSNYNFTLDEDSGDVKITKCEVLIQAKNQSIEYGSSIEDGTDQVSMTGNVEAHKLTAITLVSVGSYVKTGGTITPSEAKIEDKSGNDVTDYYEIRYQTGVLTITKKDLTVTAVKQAIQYGDFDGSKEKVTVVGNIEGDELFSVTLTPSRTDVGKGTIYLSDPVMKNGENDVTDNYKITKVDGQLVIIQKKIELDVGGSVFTYDGTADRTIKKETGVNGEELKTTIYFSPSCDAGTYSSSGYTVGKWQDDTGKASNYEITTKTGNITINKLSVDITVGGEIVYNGSFVRTMLFNTGLNNERLSIEATFVNKNIGVYEFGSEGYQLGSWADDTVSGGKANNYTVNRTEDTITINKMDLEIGTLTVGSFEYDSVTVSKYVYLTGANEELIKAQCTASSPICGTYVYVEGTVPSSGHYIIGEWQDDSGKVNNYNISIAGYGDLTISKRTVKIIAKDQEIIYGGDVEQGSEYMTVLHLLDIHELSSVVLSAPIKPHVGDYEIVPTGGTVMQGEEDVTGYYVFEYVKGTLHVTTRSAYVKVPSTTVTYNADTSNKVAVDTGFESETLMLEIEFSSRDVGVYSYGFSGDCYDVGEWSDGTGSTKDYVVTIIGHGDITVEKKDVTMRIPSCSYVYNGQTVWYSSASTGVADDRFSLTLITSSPNAGTYMYNWEDNNFTYQWSDGTGELKNYTILKTETDNGIVINKADATIRTQDTKMYDGTNLNHNLSAAEVIGLVSGDVFESGYIKTSSKDCGTYTEGMVSVSTQNGSNNYNFKQEVNLIISQRDITITSGTLSAVDGMFTGSITCESIESISGSGYVDGEVLCYDFTGSQSTVGSSPNTFVCGDSTALVGNYNIKYVYGTLKVIAKDATVTKVETDSNVLSSQEQADIIACAEYYKSIGKVQLIEISTTASELTMSAEMIREITISYSAPVSVSTYYGRVILNSEFSSSALTKVNQFNVNIATKDKSSSEYALEYNILLTADGNEIHDLGTTTKVTLFIDTSKVFPVNRTMKIVAVESGERYDAEYDGQTGELTFDTNHLSYYAVTMEENVGGPSFTAVIVVIIVCAVLALAAGILIWYLKKNFYI